MVGMKGSIVYHRFLLTIVGCVSATMLFVRCSPLSPSLIISPISTQKAAVNSAPKIAGVPNTPRAATTPDPTTSAAAPANSPLGSAPQSTSESSNDLDSSLPAQSALPSFVYSSKLHFADDDSELALSADTKSSFAAAVTAAGSTSVPSSDALLTATTPQVAPRATATQTVSFSGMDLDSSLSPTSLSPNPSNETSASLSITPFQQFVNTGSVTFSMSGTPISGQGVFELTLLHNDMESASLVADFQTVLKPAAQAGQWTLSVAPGVSKDVSTEVLTHLLEIDINFAYPTPSVAPSN